MEDGFVPTPAPVTDWITAKCFIEKPSADDTLLLPGCGTGQFAAAVQRYCSYRGSECPEMHAIETDAPRIQQFRDRFADASTPHQPPMSAASADQLTVTYPLDWSPSNRLVAPTIQTHHADFLLTTLPTTEFDYILANPPFVRYNSLSPTNRDRYATEYQTAYGRFNLYAPFVERMCDLLAPDGSLCTLLPQQFLSCGNNHFRARLCQETIHEVRPLPAATFPDHAVSACLLSLSSDLSPGMSGSFCVTSWPSKLMVGELLEGLNVPEQKHAEQIAAYYDRFRDLETRVRHRRRHEGTDGGYNPAVDPQVDTESHMQVTTDGQTDLDEWW